MVMSSPDIQRQGDFEEEDEGIQREEMAEEDDIGL
jgi:hypothetical protein